MRKAGVTDIGKQVSAVAVTVGPGLSMCLRVGVRKAQKISGEYGIPIVPVHHMEAHCLVARVKEEEWNANSEEEEEEENGGVAKFPFVALLVSGGHNVLLKVEGVGRYTILGQTLDDAIGEAYDKTARLLGLPVGGGGGPALEKLAKEYEEIVKLCGVILFNGAPVDKNPKSIEEGYYDDYKIINLYKKKKGVIGSESPFDEKEYYELIQSKEFPSFWNAIRALHFFELPLEWKEMNFEGHSIGSIYHLPDYKLELVKE